MIDKKKSILEILKNSGPIGSSFLKERVLMKLGINETEYPKSTYLKHLQDLIDEGEIKFTEEDGKRKYFLKESKNKISGEDILDKLNTRIFVPKILRPFEPKIYDWIKPEQSKNELIFHFEYNSTIVTFSIHKDSVPLNILICRKKEIKEIGDDVCQHFGNRTITLELPLAKMSSYKQSNTSGHLLLSITENNLINIKNLSSVGLNKIIKIKDLNYSNYYKIISKIGINTINTVWENFNHKATEEILQSQIETTINPPFVIQSTSECKIVIF